MTSNLDVLDVSVVIPDAETFAPYGSLLRAAPSGGAEAAFYPGVVNHAVDAFESDEDTTLVISRCTPRDLEVRYLERHFKHTQCFIPLGGRPFVLVVAPSTDDDLPDVARAEAFYFDGQAGALLAVGAWHEFPFALAENSEILTVLRRETYRGVSVKDPTTGEARNDDLDKQDVAMRFGVSLRVTVPASLSAPAA